MNIQQKLADICMMVTYIKEHVDTKPVAENIVQLDEIGKTTLKIAEMLHTVEEKTGEGTAALFESYKESIDKASDTVLEQLKEVKETLGSNTELTKSLQEKIENIYVDYTGILEQSTKKMELQRENYAEEIRRLMMEVKTLEETTRDLNEKTMTPEQISEMVNKLEKKLSDVIKQDTELNTTYEQNAEKLENMVAKIQESYQSLNDTLISVDSSFKTAVSRLDVLLMQMNLLTKERRN